MKDKIVCMYIQGVKFTAILIAVVIVFLTSPAWAMVYIGFNLSDIVQEVSEWIRA